MFNPTHQRPLRRSALTRSGVMALFAVTLLLGAGVPLSSAAAIDSESVTMILAAKDDRNNLFSHPAGITAKQAAAAARAKVGVEVLARIGSERALMALYQFSEKAKTKGLKTAAKEKVEDMTKPEGPMEKAGKKIDQAVEDTREAIKK